MKPKITINKKYSIPFDQIYALELKKWGSAWVRYIDKHGQKKIAVYQGQIDQICSILNQVRALYNLSSIKVKNFLK